MACNCKDKKMGNPNITCFVDCATEHAVIRVPYNLLIDLLKNCPQSELRDDLYRITYRASTNFCKDSPTSISGGGIARHIK